MQSILQQVLSVPGTVGALVYDRNGVLLATEFPDPYDPAALGQMARMLSEDLIVQQALQGDSGGLDLRFSGGRVLLRPFSFGAILALCTIAANSQLVSLALAQAVHRIEKGAPILEKSQPPPVVMPPPVLETTARSAALQALKRAYISYLGPIGEIIFTQKHQAWSTHGPGADGLDAFVKSIAEEIDEPAQRKDFLREAQAMLEGGRK